MKVLVVGGGGREHTIVWKLSNSPRVDKIYCAPGNGGIASLAECVPIKADDIDGIIQYAKQIKADLVFIGPDDPLALGLADACEDSGIRVFGPRKDEARLEWSKGYAKNLMRKYGIPTAGYEVYENAEDAIRGLESFRAPYVVKTDGLALGKGVYITDDQSAAADAIKSIMLDRIYGNSGDHIVIEEFLSGVEMTVLAFTDGKVIKPMLCSQDHKQAFDGDMGPNTGGMGAFAPSPVYTADVERECWEKIYAPTMEMLKNESLNYRGIIYFGLILTGEGVKVIEYNSRFGDPETQVVLPLLKNDLIDITDAVIDGRLDEIELEWEDGCCACVVAASGGYPEKYATGFEVNINDDAGALVFHAGTRLENGRFFTSGGRVLGVTAKGGLLAEAVDRAYAAVNNVSFEGMRYRSDIGRK